MAILWIAIAIVLLIFAASFVCYLLTFYSPHKGQNDPFNIPTTEQYRPYYDESVEMVKKTMAVPFVWVETTSFDGLKLSARYYHTADGAPVDICFHGYRGTAYRDFCGGARACIAHGHNVLLIDQRGNGRSGGHTITFGIRERHDCKAWIDYAIDRFGKDVRIGLYGVSMGAATVLMATGLDLPDHVYGVLADSPYSSPKDIICSVCKTLKVPTVIGYPLIRLGGRLFGGFDVEAVTAEESVKRAKMPILLVHGEEDLLVPCHMSEAIAEAGTTVTRHVFPKAGHVLSWMADRERYAAIVKEFAERA